MKKETDFPAFPSTANINVDTHFNEGMSLRDYFAAKAMNGMVNAIYGQESKESALKSLELCELVSKNAYWFADQMLKQREL
jgi:hypothetical protein